MRASAVILTIAVGASASTASAQAPEPTKVAVLELKGTGIDDATALNLGELFTAEAGKVPGFKVIGSSEVKEMVGFEIQKQTLGCSDASCFAEIGGALGVDLIISGSIGKVGETFVVNLKLIDIKRSETKNRIGESIAGRVELLPDYVRVAAWRLFGQPVPSDVQAAFEATKTRLDKAGAAKAPPPVIVETKSQPKAETKVATAAPARAPETPATNWATIPKKLCTAVGIVGLVGGAGLHGFAFYKASQLKETEKVGKTELHTGSQADAASAVKFQDRAKLGYIIGGVGIVGSIVFSILEPSSATVGLHVQPTADGLAFTF